MIYHQRIRSRSRFIDASETLALTPQEASVLHDTPQDFTISCDSVAISIADATDVRIPVVASESITLVTQALSITRDLPTDVTISCDPVAISIADNSDHFVRTKVVASESITVTTKTLDITRDLPTDQSISCDPVGFSISDNADSFARQKEAASESVTLATKTLDLTVEVPQDDTISCNPVSFSISDNESHNVNEAEQDPVADLSVSNGPGSSPCGNLATRFDVCADASGSHDPDGTIDRYDYDWGDGTTTEFGSEKETHTYDSTGSYGITVTVYDNDGNTDTASSGINIS